MQSCYIFLVDDLANTWIYLTYPMSPTSPVPWHCWNNCPSTFCQYHLLHSHRSKGLIKLMTQNTSAGPSAGQPVGRTWNLCHGVHVPMNLLSVVRQMVCWPPFNVPGLFLILPWTGPYEALAQVVSSIVILLDAFSMNWFMLCVMTFQIGWYLYVGSYPSS